MFLFCPQFLITSTPEVASTIRSLDSANRQWIYKTALLLVEEVPSALDNAGDQRQLSINCPSTSCVHHIRRLTAHHFVDEHVLFVYLLISSTT